MRLIRRTAPLLVLVSLLLGVLAACSTGPVRRVSEPMASIQQLTVQADGQWAVELRMHNYSSIPMRFDSIDLALQIGDVQAGRLQAQPGLDVGPESADVISVSLRPGDQARLLLADALAAGRGINYQLDGRTQATPQDGRSQDFKLERRSSLSPVPGLVGVLR